MKYTEYIFQEETRTPELKFCKRCREDFDTIHEEMQAYCPKCSRIIAKEQTPSVYAYTHLYDWEDAVDEYNKEFNLSFRVDKSKDLEERLAFCKGKAHPRMIRRLAIYASKGLICQNVQDLTFEECGNLSREWENK